MLDRYGSEAWVMAGGLDTFDWLKDRTKRPSVVVDLSQLADLRGIKEVDGGLEIGALTTLTEVVRLVIVALRERDLDPRDFHVAATMPTYVAPTREQAWQIAAEPLHYMASGYAQWTSEANSTGGSAVAVPSAASKGIWKLIWP